VDDLLKMAAAIPSIEAFAAASNDLPDPVKQALDSYQATVLSRAATAAQADATANNQPYPDVFQGSDGSLYTTVADPSGVASLQAVTIKQAADIPLPGATPPAAPTS